MVLCWNGTAWEEQSSLNEGGNTNTLNGVAALPSSNAWAVGLDRDGTAARMPVGPCEETTDADDR